MARLAPVVSFVARSGTGKTTFLERLIPALVARGLRVMVVKHDVHGFEVDKPGKDSYRLRRAGASRVVLSNASQIAVMGDSDGDVPLSTLIERYGGGVDLVLSEGYRRSGTPKILVLRQGVEQKTDLSELGGELRAVVADHDPGHGVPLLPLDDPEPTVEFLLERFVEPARRGRQISAVLLAGGWSKRMGSDKASLRFGGKLLLPALAERLLEPSRGRVIVVARRWQELPPLPPEARVVRDLLPQRAALGGLYTGLALSETPHVFLAACDMPLLDPALVRWMRDLPGDADVLLPERAGRAEPLHAVYGQRCLGAIKAAILSGELRMDGWHGAVRVERVAEERWRAVDPDGRSFRNANTPQELEEIEG